MPLDRNKGLYVRWNKSEKDLMIYYPRKCDGHYVHSALCSKRCQLDLKAKSGLPVEYVDSFCDELEKRGYDITTFKFSILKKDR